jgi:hypothetical protein
LQHDAAAVEVGGVGVGDDLAGAIPDAPPPPGGRLVLDPDVVTGPQHERRGPGGARRRSDADAVADVREPVVADRRLVRLRPAQVVLHRRGDVDEVVDALDVVGSLDAALGELALEERDGSLEHLADDVAEAFVLQRLALVAAHRLHLRIPELLVQRARVGTEAFRAGGRHRAHCTRLARMHRCAESE